MARKVLVSATLSHEVARLARMALQDPVTAGFDGEDASMHVTKTNMDDASVHQESLQHGSPAASQSLQIPSHLVSLGSPSLQVH